MGQNITVADAFYGCFDKMHAEETVNTYRAYRNGLMVLWNYLAHEHGMDLDKAPIQALTIEHLIQFPSFLIKNYRRSTAMVYLSAADYFFERFLVVQKFMRPDISDVMRYNEEKRHMMRKADAYEPRNVAEKDVQRMIGAAEQKDFDGRNAEIINARNLALVLVLSSSGIRNAEACKLRVRDVTWDSTHEKPFLHIEAGKGGKNRDIPFSKDAYAALKTYWTARGWRGPDDPCFARHDKGAGKRHKTMSTATVRNIISALRDTAGLEAEFTPHYFRHGVATRILRKTGNISLAQQQLGHSNIGTTAIYVHLIKDDLVEAHNKAFED